MTSRIVRVATRVLKSRRIELGVAEQDLDNTHVDILFQQMGREAMTSCWKRAMHDAYGVKLSCRCRPCQRRHGNSDSTDASLCAEQSRVLETAMPEVLSDTTSHAATSTELAIA